MSCVVIFMGGYTFWEKLEPTCPMNKVRPNNYAQPALQVWPHLPRGLCLVQSTSSPAGTTLMNEIDQGNVGLIERMRLGSLGSIGPLVRPINRHNSHSMAILCVPERRWFITRHRVGVVAPRGLAAPPDRHTKQNRPKEPTLNHLRSSDQERLRREAVNYRADRTP
jgi:hypothetical protein